MRSDVTVIISDNYISVDGVGLTIPGAELPFVVPDLWAVQWHNGAGDIELTGGKENIQFTSEEDYDKYVQPYVDVFIDWYAWTRAQVHEDRLLAPFVEG